MILKRVLDSDSACYMFELLRWLGTTRVTTRECTIKILTFSVYLNGCNCICNIFSVLKMRMRDCSL